MIINHMKRNGCHVTTHSSELVTVEDVEDFTVESYINAQVEVLPVPESAQLIARNPLPFNQLPLRNTTVRESGEELSTAVGQRRVPVFHHWLHNRYGVILQIVEHPHFPDPVVLICRLMDGLLKVGIKP